ncbi:MAG: single-stranded-DNA-specific exonuclease RecJ [Pseudomonadota bacterium]
MPRITTRGFSNPAYQLLLTHGLNPLLARIFSARNIQTVAELEASLNRLPAVDTLKNSESMAAYLAEAIRTRKNILVVADYDADGATACTVAMRGLRAFGAHVDFIVPNRFEYGYGLTPEIVHLAAEQKPDILLTVDNGIASVAGVAEANRLGIEVLVTDHHLPGDALPDARCIVNPNQPGCAFPSKNLAGVGVIFYVLLALRAELRRRGTFESQPEPNLAKLLDIVALGTVADVVKLDQPNRILVQQGLARIRAGQACPGILALLQSSRKPPAQASTYELGFIVGPRLNAAGRLEDMSLGIRCLLTDDVEEAKRLAAELDALNRTRREIEADMQQTALTSLDNFDPAERYTLTLFDENWHQGVIGILASRLKDRFHRPAIVFAQAGDDELKGSGRSIPGLHLRDALDLIAKRHPHLLQKFGGHAMAAGLSLKRQHLEDFQAAFDEVTQSLLSVADLTKTIETDGALKSDEYSLETAEALEQYVWGQGFPEPAFHGQFAVRQQRIVGEKHLKLKLSAEKQSLDAILFFDTGPLPERIEAVYKLARNEYNGQTSLQLVIEHWEAV